MSAPNRSDENVGRALQRIADNLYSPNECDSNWEAANIVDGLFAVARAIRFLAKATLVAHDKNMADYDGALKPDDR